MSVLLCLCTNVFWINCRACTSEIQICDLLYVFFLNSNFLPEWLIINISEQDHKTLKTFRFIYSGAAEFLTSWLPCWIWQLFILAIKKKRWSNYIHTFNKRYSWLNKKSSCWDRKLNNHTNISRETIIHSHYKGHKKHCFIKQVTGKYDLCHKLN